MVAWWGCASHRSPGRGATRVGGRASWSRVPAAGRGSSSGDRFVRPGGRETSPVPRVGKRPPPRRGRRAHNVPTNRVEARRRRPTVVRPASRERRENSRAARACRRPAAIATGERHAPEGVHRSATPAGEERVRSRTTSDPCTVTSCLGGKARAPRRRINSGRGRSAAHPSIMRASPRARPEGAGRRVRAYRR